MGNIFSSLFAKPSATSVTSNQLLDSQPTGSSQGMSSGGAIPGWCTLTAQYAEKQGTYYTAEMCHNAMQSDINHVVSHLDQYVVDLSPEDLSEVKNHLVLTRFDNSSDIQSGDDPRWTAHLTAQVKGQTKDRNISADQKKVLNSLIKRNSKLNRRALYDYRGRSSHNQFGEIADVYAFSGRA